MVSGRNTLDKKTCEEIIAVLTEREKYLGNSLNAGHMNYMEEYAKVSSLLDRYTLMLPYCKELKNETA